MFYEFIFGEEFSRYVYVFSLEDLIVQIKKFLNLFFFGGLKVFVFDLEN